MGGKDVEQRPVRAAAIDVTPVQSGHAICDVLIVDDFGLRRLDARQSSDFYEVVLERHRRASTVVTSNRTIDEWIPLFDDPILAQSAIDRLAHNAYQVVIEGESYRKRQRPGEPRVAVRPRSPLSSRKRRTH